MVYFTVYSKSLSVKHGAAPLSKTMVLFFRVSLSFYLKKCTEVVMVVVVVIVVVVVVVDSGCDSGSGSISGSGGNNNRIIVVESVVVEYCNCDSCSCGCCISRYIFMCVVMNI